MLPIIDGEVVVDIVYARLVGGDVVERKEAMAAGLTRYFTGKECPKGHISLRITANSNCHECFMEKIKDKGRIRAKAKAKAKRELRVKTEIEAEKKIRKAMENRCKLKSDFRFK